MMEKNLYGRSVLALIDNKKILMSGNGASPDGDMPFIDEFDITSAKSKDSGAVKPRIMKKE